MHIFTVDDQDFPELLELFQSSKLVGRFNEEGKVQVVRANQRLVMVSPGETLESILVQPARNQTEALSLAKELLAEKRESGKTTFEE